MKDKSSIIPRRGYFYIILAAVFWAVSGASGKYLFLQGISPYALIQLRLTLSAAILFVWLLCKDRALLRISRGDIFYFMVLGTAGMAMIQLCYFYSICKIQVGVAILLEYLAPAFIAIYSVLFAHRKLTRPTFTALAGSLAGCYLAVGAYNVDLLAMNWQGVLAGMGTGVAFAWYTIHGERGMMRYPPWTVVFYALLFAALFWNIFFPPLKAFLRPYSAVEWGWIIYSALFGMVIPYGLYAAGVSLIASTRGSVTATLEPITAGFLSFLFLGERLETFQILGYALVVASIILLQIKKGYDDNTAALIRRRSLASTDSQNA